MDMLLNKERCHNQEPKMHNNYKLNLLPDISQQLLMLSVSFQYNMKFAMRVYIYFRQLIVYNQQSVSLD